MNFKTICAVSTLITLFVLTGCEKDDDQTPQNPPVEEEVITTLNLTFSPVLGGGSDVVWTYSDPDGDGGNAPTINSSTPLDANTSYTTSVEFLNESETPVEDITLEVIEEGDEHQVFYQSNGVSILFTYGDSDDNGNPIGVTGAAITGSAGSGQLTVTLRHEPDKDGEFVSDGIITNAGGETDIEVSFDATIQ